MSEENKVDAYKQVLESAFARHYREGSDVWSKDDSLTEATEIALLEWQALKGQQTPSILDIGCGNGRHALLLDQVASSYTGIDLISNENWAEVTAKASVPVEFFHGDFIPWAEGKSGAFDLVLDNGCFHHQHPEDQLAYLNTVSDKVRSGGLYSLVVWGETFKEGDVDEYGRYHCHFTPESLSEFLAQASFEAMKVTVGNALIGKRQLHAIFMRR